MYGSKVQYAAEDDYSPTLDADGILRVKSIVGALLLIGREVNNKIFVPLRELGQHQAAATQATKDAIMQILDYVATYSSDGITFQARGMVLSAHFDAAYINVTKSCICSGAHIML